MVAIIRALGILLKDWRVIVGMTGLIGAVEFASERFLGEAVESVSRLWWIFALACIVILIKRYMKHSFELKKQESIMGIKNNDE